jgi:hypothetical protein
VFSQVARTPEGASSPVRTPRLECAHLRPRTWLQARAPSPRTPRTLPESRTSTGLGSAHPGPVVFRLLAPFRLVGCVAGARTSAEMPAHPAVPR